MMPASCLRADRFRRRLNVIVAVVTVWTVAQPALAAEPAASIAEARRYEHGEGVPRDIARAIRLYCEAARAGDAEAQFSLGWIYANGRGVRRSDAHAAYFFERATRAGHPNAHRMLAVVGPDASPATECRLDREQRTAASPAEGSVVEPALRLSLTMANGRN